MMKLRKNDIAVIKNTTTKEVEYKQLGELQVPYGTITSEGKVIATDYPTLITILNKQKAQIEALEKDNINLKLNEGNLLTAIDKLNTSVATLNATVEKLENQLINLTTKVK